MMGTFRESNPVRRSSLQDDYFAQTVYIDVKIIFLPDQKKKQTIIVTIKDYDN